MEKCLLFQPRYSPYYEDNKNNDESLASNIFWTFSVFHYHTSDIWPESQRGYFQELYRIKWIFLQFGNKLNKFKGIAKWCSRVPVESKYTGSHNCPGEYDSRESLYRVSHKKWLNFGRPLFSRYVIFFQTVFTKIKYHSSTLRVLSS